MTAERESMTLQEMDAPALGVEDGSRARLALAQRRVARPYLGGALIDQALNCARPIEVKREIRRHQNGERQSDDDDHPWLQDPAPIEIGIEMCRDDVPLPAGHRNGLIQSGPAMPRDFAGRDVLAIRGVRDGCV